jgi:predicted  nucleic acid-binding Zn-ribbon protein
MIETLDKIYINSAVSIRKEYLKLNNDLKKYEGLIKDLKGKVENTITKIQNIMENISKSSVEDIQKKSIEYLKTLESETQRIQKFVDPINKKIETLQKQEQALYDQIKLNYPGIENEEILSQIQRELKKRNLS